MYPLRPSGKGINHVNNFRQKKSADKITKKEIVGADKFGGRALSVSAESDWLMPSNVCINWLSKRFMKI